MTFKRFALKAYYAGLTKIYNLGITRQMVVIGAGVSFTALLLTSLGAKPEPTAEATVIAPRPTLINSQDVFDDMRTQNGGSRHISLTLQSGDSLGPLLQKNSVSPGTAYKVTEAFADIYDPRDLRVGQNINLYFDSSQGLDTPELMGISLKPSLEQSLFVTRDGEGGFTAKDMTITFPMELVQVEGTIENSLYLDAGRLGVPDKVIVQFAHIYEHSVDFQRDIRQGDNFAMAFELYRDAKGNPIKAGDLHYTSFNPRSKTMSYWLYETDAGHENYYDEDGKGAKRKLMRTPVNGARLSSSYGTRKHPVLGYTRKHNGVDFAAPRGTPIMAAGVGVIERANVYGSFGNYVRIRHSDGYKTAYAHLKSFARGIKAGARVTQGQIIGYVGTTGRSTGPHLHYEVHKDGKAINPQSLSTLSGKPLPSDEKAAFAAQRAEIDRLRAVAPPALIEVVEAVSLNTELTSIEMTTAPQN